MNEKQGKHETEYRIALLYLRELKKNNVITEEDFIKIQKKLIRKFKPVIGNLDV